MELSGPAFEPSETELFKSVYHKEGAHYNIFSISEDVGMDALRSFFPEGVANELNFCLFSTSGIHGSYTTIEEAEKGEIDCVTFLIIQPRLVCLRYGNCKPESEADFAFLKSLRQSSQDVVSKIGI